MKQQYLKINIFGANIVLLCDLRSKLCHILLSTLHTPDLTSQLISLPFNMLLEKVDFLFHD